MELLQFTDKGIYCAEADVYIDPWRPVKYALITHAHSDHSRWGNEHYLAHRQSLPVMRRRLGEQSFQSIEYGEKLQINGVNFSFHPAGHVLGSAQIRVEHQGEVWVASGDYKLQNDGVSAPFEPVACNAFITESTFGLPVYNWKPQPFVFEEINAWWRRNRELGLCSVIFAYSLGKSQRILQNIDHSIGKVYVHGAVYEMNNAYIEAGVQLQPYERVTPELDKSLFRGALVIAPSSADNTPWMKKFAPYSTGIASGWMALRGARRWQSADRGFVLSDHADWAELNTAVKATGAERVVVTHGYASVFARWLREKHGLNATDAQTRFTGEAKGKGEEEPEGSGAEGEDTAGITREEEAEV